MADAETAVGRRGDLVRQSLVFPAKRDAATRTDLVLAALETDWRVPFSVSVQAIAPGSASISVPLGEGEAVTLSDVVKQLGFEQFDGEIRVTLDSTSGLAWGVSEISGPEGLILSPPQVESVCSPDGPRCGGTRGTRTVARN